MPLKKDDSGRRWVEMEFLVPGTPEQVWQAIATGPGMSAWFTPTTVDEHVGGAITFDFGEQDCSDPSPPGVVTAWEPPVRFAYEEPGWNGDAPPVATEVVVTSRSGDRCVVRMVHSLFTEKDDWDDELESFEGGWPGFFEVLRIYLRHHAGQPAAIAHATGGHTDPMPALWSRLTAALDLDGANVGEHVDTAGSAPRLAGVVERIRQDAQSCEAMIRLDEPGAGVAVVGSCPVGDQTRAMVTLFLYGDGAAKTAAAEQPRWARWLHEFLDGAKAGI
ncbi:SRPBCC domain-containing protein [Mycolicibacterium sp. HK-90]|uniref:SRPBCC family protein n=1 Tax=Mycolicibacterium sp. HK-90 TaxID=3056937 RepID=UPI002657AB77|nr:SRPBCC domain-containing protein [Mycolicibacterium sp. HK-90]WKG04180.1 SRPBCC domain-containing protein [Mycolicibacterium sp. HK-90]